MSSLAAPTLKPKPIRKSLLSNVPKALVDHGHSDSSLILCVNTPEIVDLSDSVENDSLTYDSHSNGNHLQKDKPVST